MSQGYVRSGDESAEDMLKMLIGFSIEFPSTDIMSPG